MIRKILVSQPQPETEKNPYFEVAQKHGLDIVFRPFIKTEGLTAREFRQQRIQILDYTAIVFTSKHSIAIFFQLCKELRVNIPDDMKYFVTSETVSRYMQHFVQYRKRKVFFGKTGKFADLVTVMMKHKSEKFLVPQNDQHNAEVERLLTEKGLNYKTCVMYRTVSVPYVGEEKFDFDMVVLFHPSGLEGLIKSFDKFEQGNLKIATFGNAAKRAVEESGLRLDVYAPTPEVPNIATAIDNFVTAHNKLEREQQAKAASETKAKEAKKTVKKAVAKKAAEKKASTPAKKKAASKKPTASTENSIPSIENPVASTGKPAAATKKTAAAKKTATSKKAAASKPAKASTAAASRKTVAAKKK